MLPLANGVETGPRQGRRNGAAHGFDSRTLRRSVLHAGDFFAQQFVLDADAGDQGFEPPSLLVFDVRLAALKSGLAAGQEAVAPLDELVVVTG